MVIEPAKQIQRRDVHDEDMTNNRIEYVQSLDGGHNDPQPVGKDFDRVQVELKSLMEWRVSVDARFESMSRKLDLILDMHANTERAETSKHIQRSVIETPIVSSEPTHVTPNIDENERNGSVRGAAPRPENTTSTSSPSQWGRHECLLASGTATLI